MRHLPFDDPKLDELLARAYPAHTPDERAALLVELMIFVRALAGLVERGGPRARSGARERDRTGE